MQPDEKLYARTLPDRPRAEWELLEAHAARVAELAGSFASAFDAAEWGKVLGRSLVVRHRIFCKSTHPA